MNDVGLRFTSSYVTKSDSNGNTVFHMTFIIGKELMPLLIHTTAREVVIGCCPPHIWLGSYKGLFNDLL